MRDIASVRSDMAINEKLAAAFRVERRTHLDEQHRLLISITRHVDVPANVVLGIPIHMRDFRIILISVMLSFLLLVTSACAAGVLLP